MDGDKLMGFVFRAVDEIGATLNTALVVMGDRLGFYRALAGAGPLTPAELAERTGTAERYVREWLNAQAAGGYVDYDPDTVRYTLPAEHAVALTDESSPAYLPGFFQIALGTVHDSPRITEAAKTGVGIGWHGGHCGYCDNCRRGDFLFCTVRPLVSGISADGGYADHVVAPAVALARIPERQRAALLLAAAAIAGWSTVHLLDRGAPVQVATCA